MHIKAIELQDKLDKDFSNSSILCLLFTEILYNNNPPVHHSRPLFL